MYYIPRDVWENEVCVGYDAQDIARAMIDRKLMERGEDRLTLKRRLPGLGNVRVFAVRFADDSDQDSSDGAGTVGTAGTLGTEEGTFCG